jgi:DNA-binding transcriptional ArsR family regulator
MTSEPDHCDLLCLDLEKAESVRDRVAEFDLATPARRARALGDPTRLRMASALAATDELCVCDLAWIIGRSDKLVSHHVRTLRDAGIAESRRDGKIVFYRLTATGAALLASVLSSSAAPPSEVTR